MSPVPEHAKITSMSDKKRDEKLKALQMAVDRIEKAYGKGAIMRLGDKQVTQVDAIPTGSLSLDIALGVNGFPRGRVVEIFGPESSGKTTLAIHAIAECQKQGGIAAFIDAEHAFDRNYSVAALVPRSEIEGEMGDSKMGLQARLMSQAMRKLTAAIGRTGCCCIFINQLREKIGVLFGNPETTTGGNALKFYASMRLDIRRSGAAIKDKEGNVIGNRVKVKVVKNKLAPPFRVAEFDIMYGEGISKVGEIVDLGVDHDIIQKSGSWYSYGGAKIAQGRESIKQFLEDNPELAHEIEMKIKAKILGKELPETNGAEEGKKEEKAKG